MIRVKNVGYLNKMEVKMLMCMDPVALLDYHNEGSRYQTFDRLYNLA